MSYSASDHTFVICAYKQSRYLEECIESLMQQSVKSNILLTTSTPNDFIKGLCDKYGLEMLVNNGTKGIGGDWNFAYDSVKTPLVTIAHQDDVYLEGYLESILNALNTAKEPIIAFCHYAELRDGETVCENRNLMIKKLMLSPLKINSHGRFFKRLVIAYGNPVCCPAVTYVKDKVGDSPFTNDFGSNIDWQQWERLSEIKGSFAYTDSQQMCHRVHDESTTSDLIGDNSRTKEDYEMLLHFHSKPVAKLLIKPYSKGQDSNKL